jgi:enterochelin esterase-like enzyme
MAQLADHPWNVFLANHRVLAIRPEALRVKLLERPARKFEPVLTCFSCFLRRVHVDTINPLPDTRQASSFARTFSGDALASVADSLFALRATTTITIMQNNFQHRAQHFCRRVLSFAFTLLLALNAIAAPTDDVYQLGPDSAPHDGVPKGKVIGPLTLASEVFTNTTRHYWIYVPAQYDAKKPASLMVFQDGQAFVGPGGDYRVPFVFDNLIYRREMPVTLAVFINPGRLPTQQESTSTNWGDGINGRATEYNELNDNYAKLIVNELLPALEKDYNISKNPDDRAIGGASSGAICAFTVAWQRPDQFRKVLSTIGSFTNIRGGHAYPELVRQSERKPIRIFLQDGLNDNRGRRRGTNTYDPKWDWHAQNRLMVAALTEKGYDVNYCWGIGTHSNKQGGAMLPEMLRWLWRDYPRPDDPQDDSNRKLFVPINN